MSQNHHTADATLTNDRAHVFHSWSAQAEISPLAIAGAEGVGTSASVAMLFGVAMDVADGSLFGQHALQRTCHRNGVSRGQQIGQVLHGNAHLVDIRNLTVDTDVPGLCRRCDG